ncbi:zinc metalloprotease [Nonomuraea endophytica]|uniref:zinc metalloprotease n=1 Tax=Nonomuraea endophytica TaxID=714136 RepID=UPI0037CA574F
MARRATAVLLVCLLAAVPPIDHSAAAAASCERPAVPRLSAERPPDVRAPHVREPDPRQVREVLAELGERLGDTKPPTSITIPTWVHVLTDGRRRAPDEAVRSQIAALNSAYGGQFGGVDTGVRFRLDGITLTRNTSWFGDPLGHEAAMKGHLRKGGVQTLNLYVGQLSELVLGFSTYPFWYASGPRLDGVVVDWRSLPGGALRNFDLGFTGVHEIGHWLGLFHTFENGCEEPGDGVDDTPPEALPTEGCPGVKDTCPLGGTDPIRNFMDYSYDRCMKEFTQGQAVRMHEMWAAYRGTET